MLGKSKERLRIEWLMDAPNNGNWYEIGRDKDRLRVALEEYADKHKAPERVGDAMVSMLERQIFNTCSISTPYHKALIQVLNDYNAWGRKVQTDATTLYTYLEMSGFQYPSHTQTIKLLDSLWMASQTAYMKSADPKSASPPHRAEMMALVSGFSVLAGWNVHTQSGVNTPISSPELPALAVDVMRELLPDEDTYSNVALVNDESPKGIPGEVAMVELWLIILEMERAGASQSLIPAFFKTNPLNLFVGLALLDNELINKKVLVEPMNYPQFVLRNDGWVEKVRAWMSDGCRGTILSHKSSTHQVPASSAPKIVRLRPTRTTRARQTPTGRKRHHWNFTGEDEETPQIDWDDVAVRLKIKDLFPRINEQIACAALVHGLMRQGDRPADLNQNALKRNAFWKAGRRGMQSESRRDFDRAVGTLVSNKVITFKRGYYKLAPRNERFPKASEMIKRVQALRASLLR